MNKQQHIEDFVLEAKEIKRESVNPTNGNVTSEKFNDWVYRLWVTSPSSMSVNAFYQRFRDSLWDMYCSNADEKEAKP